MNPFRFLTPQTNLLERAVDNAAYWMKACKEVERERDQWRDKYYDAIEKKGSS